jgi:hypothetical protein
MPNLKSLFSNTRSNAFTEVNKNNRQKFFDKYKGVLSAEQVDKLEDVALGLKRKAVFPRDEIVELDTKRKVLTDFNNLLSKTAELNSQGMAFEKEGKIEDAIRVFEENIFEGHSATHSYERLMVIYHREKKYHQEIRVIKRALEVFTAENKRRFDFANENPENFNLKENLRKGFESCSEVRNLKGWSIYVPYPVKKWNERLEKLEK